jgi:hypothetical protein
METIVSAEVRQDWGVGGMGDGGMGDTHCKTRRQHSDCRLQIEGYEMNRKKFVRRSGRSLGDEKEEVCEMIG